MQLPRSQTCNSYFLRTSSHRLIVSSSTIAHHEPNLIAAQRTFVFAGPTARELVNRWRAATRKCRRSCVTPFRFETLHREYDCRLTSPAGY